MPFRTLYAFVSCLCLTMACSPTCSPTTAPRQWCGDGWCDSELNNPSCSYDSGDCCQESCTPATYSCGVVGYSCVDPAYNPTGYPTPFPTFPSVAPTKYPTNFPTPPTNHPSPMPTRFPTPHPVPQCPVGCGATDIYMCGNGRCENATNTRQCDYDGGDCCSSTCHSSTWTCGHEAPFICRAETDSGSSSGGISAAMGAAIGGGVVAGFIMLGACVYLRRRMKQKRGVFRRELKEDAKGPQSLTMPESNARPARPSFGEIELSSRNEGSIEQPI